MKKIGILGGTFDPIHEQHIKIAIKAKQKLDLDEVWILPTKGNPLKGHVTATFKERIAMINLAISKNSDWLKLNEYELTNNCEVNYTVDTMRHFTKVHPHVNFYFIIGSDNLLQLNKWDGIHELSRLVQLTVVNRPSFLKTEQLMNEYHCIDLKVEPELPVSSSAIRTGKMFEHLNPKVLEYINTHLIYSNTILKDNLDNERYEHSIHVANTAKKLAMKYGTNPEKAYSAGLFHDVAKQWSIQKTNDYLRKYYPEGLTVSEKIKHAYTGALYLKHDLKFTDADIINAVFKHTTGAKEMSELDFIVFLADKISPERNFPQVDKIRELAKTNLPKAFCFYLELLEIKLKNSQSIVDDEFYGIYNKWKKMI